jgi:signal transduction histidine kinase/CheY-like chemotaxis protein
MVLPDSIEKLRNSLIRLKESGLSAKHLKELEQFVVSVEKFLELKDRESKRQLEHLARAASLAELGAMTAAVIHETNQPLLGIKSFAELILEGSQQPEPDKLSQWAQEILNQVNRIQEYQERTQNFFRRADVGVPAELSQAVDDALLLFQQRMRKKEIRGGVKLPSDLPRLDISPVHLSQILINLVDNALDAMEGRQSANLRINARVDDAGQSVRVIIADTGTGIADEISSTLFEPFYSTKGKSGTGLGLYVSRALAEANGGTLEMIDPSSLGWKETPGAAFALQLPCSGAAESTGEARQPEDDSSLSHQSLSLRMKNFVRHLPSNRDVLIVDDEPVILKVLVDYLARHDIPSDQVLSAEQALEQLSQKQYSVALIDKNLPGIDGIELLHVIKQKWPLTEVIIITGYESKESALQAIREGAFDYIPKPFPSLSYIIDKVQGAIARRNFEARLQSVIQFLSKTSEEVSGEKDQAEQARRLKELMTSFKAPEGLKRLLVVGSRSRADAVEALGYEIHFAENLRAALTLVRQEKVQTVVFVERKDDGIPGARAVEVFRQVDPHIGVFVLAQVGQLRRIVDAIGAGVGDYMVYPMEGEELFAERLKRLVGRQERLARYQALIAALQDLNVDILTVTAVPETPR